MYKTSSASCGSFYLFFSYTSMEEHDHVDDSEQLQDAQVTIFDWVEATYLYSIHDAPENKDTVYEVVRNVNRVYLSYDMDNTNTVHAPFVEISNGKIYLIKNTPLDDWRIFQHTWVVWNVTKWAEHYSSKLLQELREFWWDLIFDEKMDQPVKPRYFLYGLKRTLYEILADDISITKWAWQKLWLHTIKTWNEIKDQKRRSLIKAVCNLLQINADQVNDYFRVEDGVFSMSDKFRILIWKIVSTRVRNIVEYNIFDVWKLFVNLWSNETIASLMHDLDWDEERIFSFLEVLSATHNWLSQKTRENQAWFRNLCLAAYATQKYHWLAIQECYQRVVAPLVDEFNAKYTKDVYLRRRPKGEFSVDQKALNEKDQVRDMIWVEICVNVDVYELTDPRIFTILHEFLSRLKAWLWVKWEKIMAEYRSLNLWDIHIDGSVMNAMEDVVAYLPAQKSKRVVERKLFSFTKQKYIQALESWVLDGFIDPLDEQGREIVWSVIQSLKGWWKTWWFGDYQDYKFVVHEPYKYSHSEDLIPAEEMWWIEIKVISGKHLSNTWYSDHTSILDPMKTIFAWIKSNAWYTDEHALRTVFWWIVKKIHWLPEHIIELQKAPAWYNNMQRLQVQLLPNGMDVWTYFDIKDDKESKMSLVSQIFNKLLKERRIWLLFFNDDSDRVNLTKAEKEADFCLVDFIPPKEFDFDDNWFISQWFKLYDWRIVDVVLRWMITNKAQLLIPTDKKHEYIKITPATLSFILRKLELVASVI